MPDDAPGGDKLAAVAGAGSVSTSGAVEPGAGAAGAALVSVGAVIACGSFERR